MGKNYCVKEIKPGMFPRCGFVVEYPERTPFGKIRCTHARRDSIFYSQCRFFAIGHCLCKTARKELKEIDEESKTTNDR